MTRLMDRWFGRGIAVALVGALWCIALKLPGDLTPGAQAGMKKAELGAKHDLTTKEYAQLLLNSHPYIRILTPHLTSEYVVKENAVMHVITFDKEIWTKEKIAPILNGRHQNAVTAMKGLGLKDFQLADIQTEFQGY